VHPDGLPDEPVPEAEVPDQHREDARPLAPGAWDASDVVPPDAADAADLRRAPADADAEKLAVPAPDVRARDAWSRRVRRFAQPARLDAAAELCTPDAVLSAEQSCAALEAAAVPQQPGARADAAQSRQVEVRQML